MMKIIIFIKRSLPTKFLIMNNLVDVKIKSQFLNIVILGFLLTFVGIVLIVQTQYVGIAPLILGLTIVSFKKGILIDLENRKIKYYQKIVFITIGNWADCNDVQYIALTQVKLTQQMHAVTVPGTYTDIQVKLNFIFDNNRVVAVFTDKKSKVMQIAKQIASNFNLDIFDNSEGKKEWIRTKI